MSQGSPPLADALSIAAAPSPPGVAADCCAPGAAGAGEGGAAACWPKGVDPKGVATTGKADARLCPEAGIVLPSGEGAPKAGVVLPRGEGAANAPPAGLPGQGALPSAARATLKSR